MAEPAPPAVEGGVDGSGGNLFAFNFESFADHVATTHPAIMRDIAHRMILIENSGEESDPHGLRKRLIGNQKEFLAKASANIYYAVEKFCPSQNHPNGDGAYMPDGRICISYEAFKRFPLESQARKMVNLSIHELAHAAGMTEAEAQTLQNSMELSFGDKVVLFYNARYKQLTDQFRQAVGDVVSALHILMSRDSVDPKSATNKAQTACLFLNRAYANNVRYHTLSLRIPHYLAKNMDEFYLEVARGATDCLDSSVQELAAQTVLTLEKAMDSITKLSEYDSALCTPQLCGTKFNSGLSPADALARWKVLGPYVRKEIPFPKPLPQADAYKVDCQLTDLSTNQTRTFESVTWTQLVKSDDKYDEYELDIITGDYDQDGDIKIKLGHKLRYAVVSGDFVESTNFEMTAYLMKGRKNKVTARLAQREIFNDAFETTVGATKYMQASYDHFMEPSTETWAMKAVPKVLKEYDLTCEIK